MPLDTNAYMLDHTSRMHGINEDSDRWLIFCHAEIDPTRHALLLEKSLSKYGDLVIWMIKMATCMCTGRCRKPPYTCSGASEPDFLTAQQRYEHDLAYLRGETNFRYPFEPWVIRSWAQHLDAIGGFEIAREIRKNIDASVEIANDPTLTHRQKMRKLRARSVAGRSGKKKGRD